ncbi:TolB family protein [Ekhidna sp.]|uniref:TolB family protein n=1 Tax=Ekhidna sp. TaxID=2608089 RepID=UPI003B50EF22
MMKNFTILFLTLSVIACQQNAKSTNESDSQTVSDTLKYDKEVHLKNVKQLTWGGNNAEAYWSFDGESLVFQSDYSDWGVECDQIFTLDASNPKKGEMPNMVSTGLGRTTCAYFLPGDSLIVYGSTHLADSLCPATPDRNSGKYVWPIYAGYDIFVADLDGKIVNQLTSEEGYDAEATVSPNGDRIIFTSTRSGDLELYTMNLDGSDVVQITDELGYDGGAFFSPDGSKIVWRASRPQSEEEIVEYKGLLAQGLVQPTKMELYVANADGSEARKITSLGNANWAPFFTPDGQKILFSSNHASQRGFPFNLFMINLDGTGLEQVTFDDTFDSFPMFSPDGKYLVWASNRNNGGTRDTNLFVAEWVD